MSKRLAADQITRENFGGRRDSSDDEAVQQNSKASVEVMAKRKILKPRGKGKATFGGDASAVANGGAFGKVSGGFGSSFGTSLQASAPASGAKTEGLFKFSSASPQTVVDKNEKIKALNYKFIETINSNNKSDSVCDFSGICKKYIEYYEKIHNGEIKLPATASSTSDAVSAETTSSIATNGFAASKQQKPSAENESSSESDSEPEKETKIEGPKFVLGSKPTVKKSPFSFGPKPPKKPSSDSDSESEVEIKGPTFTFNKPIQDKVFKLPSNKGTIVSESANKEEEVSISNPDENSAGAFGSKEAPNPFSFNPPKSGEPAFSSADKKVEDIENTPAFSFGTNPTTVGKSLFGENSQAKPAFSFGSFSKTSDKSENKPADKPSFTFGSTSKLEESNGKPFSFGAAATDTSEKKPAFGATNPQENKSSFTFGSTAKPAEKTNTESKSFSFGSAQAGGSGNPFTFTPQNKTEDAKNPAESSTSDAPKPSFQFSFNPPKNTATPEVDNQKPAFSFGSSTNTFGNNNASLGFSFNANKSEEKQDADPSKDLVEEEETGGNFEPVVKLSEKVEVTPTGEEDEEVLYTKRAKLMLFSPTNKEEPYANKGLGELKVLKSKATNKSRMLVRADGGLRVLLNALVSKDMTYSTIGNGSMVRVPTVDPATKSIETYVLKVKTPADGQDLLKVLNDAKI